MKSIYKENNHDNAMRYKSGYKMVANECFIETINRWNIINMTMITMIKQILNDYS